MTDSIKDKLRAAECGSRELDAEIMFALFAEPFGEHEEHPGKPLSFADKRDGGDKLMAIPFYGRTESWVRKVRNHGRGPIKPETLIVHHEGVPVLLKTHLVPNLSTSIDAALSLIEEVLPGWEYGVMRRKSDFECYVNNGETHHVGVGARKNPALIWKTERGPDACLCLILSLLDALAARETGDA